jgi:hypothetical protein
VSQFYFTTNEEHEVLFPFQEGAERDQLVVVEMVVAVADQMFWTLLYALPQACLDINVL